ncbi:RNA polymerase factor sigma-32 [Rubrimonas cliftonensis]|uniref:RNA polymerase, sigma 32 subunit, RpoH n=1 Tax=Rubrimonas cliftonensis TaxID=89524 RepID=A0A1H4AL20_9RHOB|nr:RNA polymerase factor sigma-32 [Rubrimonas cliftonensis]SEA36646.1 RNA polymerase, sigma 32 subunit, RpoH [Rubrimonas cliftonensis]
MTHEMNRSVGSVAHRAMSAELLDAETELALARAWRDEGDEAALHRLVTAYMRLAISMAAKYRRYGASMNDLIQEAGVGLMKAASKFDPDRGVRFSTYAVWWIKASIQDYVMRNWSLVRTGSTSSQKSLFFNMRRVRAKLERERGTGLDGSTSAEIRQEIADELGCPLRDVEMMEARLAGSDFSLNAQQAGEEGREWVETLEDGGPRPDESVSRDSDVTTARKWLIEAFDALTPRERMIIAARKLNDDAETLESLGGKLGLSKERVRQLEAQALRKMKKRLETRFGDAASELAVAM